MLSKEAYIITCRNWVEQIVIKHNFCPFAHKPAKHNLIRYQVSLANDENDLIADIIDELSLLQHTDPNETETSILIAPACFADFDQYNQFLDVIDALIKQFNLEGIIQVASFHPDYQFADLEREDVRNYTNRSPYPMFHFIREDSIESARSSMQDTELIPERNMAFLETLGVNAIQIQLNACFPKKSDDPSGE